MTATAAPNLTYSTREDRADHIDAIKERINVLTGRQKETAQYIADMILELRNMAKSSRLFQVMVPLEYAYYEAFSAANRVEIPEDEIERLKVLAKASESEETAPADY